MLSLKVHQMKEVIIMATDKRKALEREYRKLAKRADQRLVRLEEYAEREGFAGILKFAYRKAMRDIKVWAGDKATRFNTKPPSNTNQLKAKIKDIQTFLQSASSTLGKTKETSGVLDIYERRANTLNEKYGTNFTWQDLAKFFESGINEKLDNRLDSDTKMSVIAQIQANQQTIEKALKTGSDVHLDIDDDVVDFEVQQVLNDYGLKEIGDLFGSR